MTGAMSEQVPPTARRNVSALRVTEDVGVEDRDPSLGSHYHEAYWQRSRKEVNCVVQGRPATPIWHFRAESVLGSVSVIAIYHQP
jgi:hypothetical protein